jgi:hypothetical protein
MAESTGRPAATGLEGERGIWQIGTGHGSLSTYDPLGNARAAIAISDGGYIFNQWTTFTSGKYRGMCKVEVPSSVLPASVLLYSDMDGSVSLLSRQGIYEDTWFMPQPKSRWDLSNFTTATDQKKPIGFFQAFGLTPTYSPTIEPRLTVGAASNAVPLSSFAPQAQTTTGNSSSGSQQSPNAKGLVNPIGPGLVPGRTDMGVDYTGSGPLYAIGDGTITNVYNRYWPGGVFIGLKLKSTGQYVYYAENISPKVRVGQTVKAGQQIGWANGGSPWIEVGWAAAPGTGNTLAKSTTGYTEGQVTPAGTNFRNLLKKLGAKT